MKIKMIIGTIFIFAVSILTTFVFGKLENYKKEIKRLNNYNRVVTSRCDENVNILFKRLNALESNQQDLEETIYFLKYKITHEY